MRLPKICAQEMFGALAGERGCHALVSSSVFPRGQSRIPLHLHSNAKSAADGHTHTPAVAAVAA